MLPVLCSGTLRLLLGNIIYRFLSFDIFEIVQVHAAEILMEYKDPSMLATNMNQYMRESAAMVLSWLDKISRFQHQQF